MALIKCPECGKEISNRAEKCPNCGYPIIEKVDSKKQGKIFIDQNKSNRKNEQIDSIKVEDSSNLEKCGEEKKSGNFNKTGCAIFAIGLILIMLVMVLITCQPTDTAVSADGDSDVAMSEIIDKNAIKKGKEDLSNYFYKEYDDMENTTWYNNANEPEYIDTRSYVLPYIGKDIDKHPWVVIRWNYTGNDWIFYNEIIVKTDKHTYYISPNYSDINHDNDTEVWETYDQVNIEEKDLKMLKDMGSSKKCKVRFSGDNHNYDFSVSDSDKRTFTATYNAYYYLLDKYNNQEN